MDKPPTIGITGSSGLVGSALVSYFSDAGFQVRAFQRSLPEHAIPGVTYYSFDLADIRDNGFAGADYIIHCAYRPVVGKRERESGVNVDIEAAKKIIALAQKHGARVIFISTTSAHEDSRSYYARTKFSIEQLCNPQSDLVLKLGLVLGGKGGLFGKIRNNISRHKIVPLIGGGRQQVQTIALDDICRVIESGIARAISGTFSIAHPAAVSMKEIYRRTALLVGASPLFIPMSGALVYTALNVCERIGIRLPFTAENVLGLSDLRVADTAADIATFDVSVKDCQATFHQLSFET